MKQQTTPEQRAWCKTLRNRKEGEIVSGPHRDILLTGPGIDELDEFGSEDLCVQTPHGIASLGIEWVNDCFHNDAVFIYQGRKYSMYWWSDEKPSGDDIKSRVGNFVNTIAAGVAH